MKDIIEIEHERVIKNEILSDERYIIYARANKDSYRSLVGILTPNQMKELRLKVIELNIPISNP